MLGGPAPPEPGLGRGMPGSNTKKRLCAGGFWVAPKRENARNPDFPKRVVWDLNLSSITCF